MSISELNIQDCHVCDTPTPQHCLTWVTYQGVTRLLCDHCRYELTERRRVRAWGGEGVRAAFPQKKQADNGESA